MKLDNRHIILHLSLIKGIGSATIERILKTLNHKPEIQLKELYNFKESEIKYFFKLTDNTANKIRFGLQDFKVLDKELNLIEKNGIKWVTTLDSEYPELLNSIYLPPAVLYFKGLDLTVHKKNIAVVGSRKADKYGAFAVEHFLPELIINNWSIVSGGARGIDILAHKIAVKNNGYTIVVLGSGLLNPYPQEHTRFFDNIVTNALGTIMSPFPLTSSALPQNFPARNRIISGLSKACVIIQAAESSGALITGQFALEQGREVCAIPGSIDNPLSAGCNKIIGQGAHLVTSAYDIRSVLQDLSYDEVKNKNRNKLRVKNCPKTQEEQILSYVSNEPISFDELLSKTELGPDELQNYLWNLQIGGFVNQNFMGLWIKSE